MNLIIKNSGIYFRVLIPESSTIHHPDRCESGKMSPFGLQLRSIRPDIGVTHHSPVNSVFFNCFLQGAIPEAPSTTIVTEYP
jgi:hypothetical protein